MRPQGAEPSEVAVVRKLRNADALPMMQKFPEKSPVAPSYGQKKSSRGVRRGVRVRGVKYLHLPPGQSLTNGVNQLGPKGSQPGDPNPNRTLIKNRGRPNWDLVKTAESPPQAEDPKSAEIAPSSTKTRFLKPQQKNKNKFFDYFLTPRPETIPARPNRQIPKTQ